MSKIEEKALKAYPVHSTLILPARRGGYYADNHLREGYIEGYRQALEDMREELTQRLLPTIRDKFYDDWDEGQNAAFLDIITFIVEQSK